MAKNENSGIDARKIIICTLVGLIIYILLISFFAVLIKFELIPHTMMKYASKLCLFAACLFGCTKAKSKSRGEPFINYILICFLIFGLLILMVSMNSNTKYDVAGIIVCILLCVLSCYLVLLKKNKNSKLHKRRK